MANPPRDSAQPLRDLTDDEKQLLHYNPNTSDLVEFVQAYAREALRAKALTAPNLSCKSAQARLATQWGYVMAASVEPVGSIDHVEWSASKEQWRHNIWADKKIPFGTKLYAGAPPAHIPADVRSCIACAMREQAIGQLPDQSVTPAYLEWLTTKSRSNGVGGNEAWNAGAAWQATQPQAVAASSPATAVDAGDELPHHMAIVREYLTDLKRQVPAKSVHAVLAALQASRQPETAQAVAEGAGVVIGWGLIASNTGKVCRVTMDRDDIEGMKPEHVVPLVALATTKGQRS